MDEIEIKPDNTYAVIVGLDQYSEPGYELNNAVREAVAFAEWLVEKGLGAGHIKLFVSGGEEDILQPLKDRGVQPQGPSGIRDALRNPPFTTDRNPPFTTESPDNLLLLYWAGHGSTDTLQRQILWDWKYKRGDKLVFDLEDIRMALRSENWRAFRRQIILVNACARADDAGGFNKEPFAGLPLQGQHLRKQFTICAASPSENVGDGGRKETSPFFNLLLRLLKAMTRHGGPFRISEACDAICAEALRLGHTPRIEWINWSGSHFLWSDDALSRLVQNYIGRCDVPFDTLEELYRQCVETPVDVDGVAMIINHLNGAKLTGDRRMNTRYGGALDFAVRAIHCHKAQSQKLAELDQALNELFDKNPEYEMPLLENARKLIGEEYRKPSAPFFLSIAPATNEETITYFLHDSTGARILYDQFRLNPDETLDAALCRLFNEKEKELKNFTNYLRFHFFLGLEKLSLDLHEWPDPTRPRQLNERLESHHRVALRSLERAREADGWGFAAGRWRSIANEIRSRNKLRINWLNEPDFVCATEEHECVGVSTPPSSQQLYVALQEGLPFLIWPRKAEDGWNECMTSINDIECDGGLDLAMDGFPRIRRKHSGVPFAVLWDDPAQNPYDELVPLTDIP